jgi:biuret amidohydrolase
VPPEWVTGERIPIEPGLTESPPMDSGLASWIEPSRTALLVIDVQVDFVAPDGAMGRVGLDLSATVPALARVEQLIAAARAVGVAPVFARVVTQPATDPTALKLLMKRKGMPTSAVDLCRADTLGADYYRIRPLPGEIEIRKTLFSSFVGTTLDEQLKARGIDTLVVVGFTTDCCVDCSVRDAFHRDYNVFIATDGCAAYSRELHEGALNGLAQNCALLVESDAVMQAWSTSKNRTA